MNKKIIMTVLLATAVMSYAADDEIVSKNWELNVNLGANLSSGNTETYMVNWSTLLKYQLDPSTLKLGFDLSYGEVEETDDEGNNNMVKDTDKYNLFANYEYNFTERYFASAIAEWLHDYKAGIDYRYRIGPNIGVNILKNDTFLLDTSFGVSYVYEEYEDKFIGSDDYMGLRFAEDFTWNINEKGVKLVQGLVYLPDSDDFDKYLLNFAASVEAPISQGLSMFVKFKDEYNSKPVDDKEKNDTSLILGLQYSL